MTSQNVPSRHRLHDILKTWYDDRAPGYDTELNEHGEVWHLNIAKDLVNWSKPYVLPNLRDPVRVLDICCGTGMVAFHAYEQFGPSTVVHGVDFSAKSIHLATNKAKGIDNIKFFEGSATELDSLGLQKGSYSLITCCSAFVLLPSHIETLKSWREYLAPGGILSLDITAPGTQVVTDFMSMSIPDSSRTVDRRWIQNNDSLVNLFTEAGFDCKDVILTPVYTSKQYEIGKAEDIFDKMSVSAVYRLGIEHASKEEMDAMKAKFLELMKSVEGENGIITDTTQLLVGIAQRKV